MIDFIHERGGDVTARNHREETMLHICTKNLRSAMSLLGKCSEKLAEIKVKLTFPSRLQQIMGAFPNVDMQTFVYICFEVDH